MHYVYKSNYAVGYSVLGKACEDPGDLKSSRSTIEYPFISAQLLCMKEPLANTRTKIRSNCTWIGSGTHRHVCVLNPDADILPIIGPIFPVEFVSGPVTPERCNSYTRMPVLYVAQRTLIYQIMHLMASMFAALNLICIIFRILGRSWPLFEHVYLVGCRIPQHAIPCWKVPSRQIPFLINY